MIRFPQGIYDVNFFGIGNTENQSFINLSNIPASPPGLAPAIFRQPLLPPNQHGQRDGMAMPPSVRSKPTFLCRQLTPEVKHKGEDYTNEAGYLKNESGGFSRPCFFR